MRKTKIQILLSFLFLMSISPFIAAQDPITLTFTGRDQYNQHVKLDNVLIDNVTKLWQEVLYYPDTVLHIGGTGMQNHVTEKPEFHLFQNVPNPFEGETDFSLQLPEASAVRLEIFDLNGKTMANYTGTLEQGVHLFKARLTTPQTYLLNARTDNGVLQIKMVNTGHAGQNSLEYLGMGGMTATWEEQSGAKGGTLLPFTCGDLMRYKGFSLINDFEFIGEEIQKTQTASENITFNFNIPFPIVSTLSASSITGYSGQLNGRVTSDEGYTVTERGFAFADNMDLNNASTYTAGSGTGDFSYTVSDLQPGTSYYYRVFATNAIGINYGETKFFSTAVVLPEVTTIEVTDITYNEANCSGDVTYDGGATVTARGVCWSTSQNPTINGSHTTNGNGTGNFTSSITGLTAGTTYYVRAYATNSAGTAYGEQLSFTTIPAVIPTVTTHNVSNITASSATCDGDVTATGGTPVTARGVCWSTSQNPTVSDSHTIDGVDTGSFTSDITGLAPNTTYYVRAYATNEIGTAYGEQQSFTTITLPPTVSTNTISDITATSATCGGNVTADGGATVTARGVCWSTSQNPTISNSHTSDGTGTGSFTSSITSLTAGTTYYVRAYATNSAGTAYGEQRSFIPQIPDGSPCLGTAIVTDYDNNTYNTVKIGNQCWMKENLRTTHYANGTSIALGSSTSTTTAYRYYPNNSSSDVSTYGYLYNWKAVMRNSSSSSANPSGVQGICPTGWHVPSDAEWTQLTDYVSSQSQYWCGGNNGMIAKAMASTTGWNSTEDTCEVGNNPGANNATGFSVLPAGYHNSGIYGYFGRYAYFWSATEYSDYQVYTRLLRYNNANVDSRYGNKNYEAVSVRCVRD